MEVVTGNARLYLSSLRGIMVGKNRKRGFTKKMESI